MCMIRKGSVRFNFIMHFGIRVFSALCAAAAYPFVFRTLGAESVGKTAFATSVFSFFSILSAIGLPTYGVRECARVREDSILLSKTVHELLLLQMIAASLSTAFLLLSICFIPRLREEWRLFLIQAGVLAIGAFNTEWLFAGMEQYGYISLRSASAKLLTLSLFFLLLRTKNDYLVYAALLGLGTVLPYIIDWIMMKRFLPLRKQGFYCEIKQHIRPALMFTAQMAAITVYTSLDSAMLGFLSGDYWVGIYDSAIKIKMMLSYFITSMGTVLMPRLSSYIHEKEDEAFRYEISRSLEFTLLSGIPLTLFFFIMAPECILFLFGSQFQPAIGVLRILAPTVFLIGCSGFTGVQVLTPTGNEHIVMYSVFAGAAVDFVLNLLFIPRYNAAGAAISTLAAEMVVLGIEVVKLRKLLPGLVAESSLPKIIVASLVATVVLLTVKFGVSAGTFEKQVIGTASYFCSVAGLLLLWKEPLTVEAWKRVFRYLSRKAGRGRNED